MVIPAHSPHFHHDNLMFLLFTEALLVLSSIFPSSSFKLINISLHTTSHPSPSSNNQTIFSTYATIPSNLQTTTKTYSNHQHLLKSINPHHHQKNHVSPRLSTLRSHHLSLGPFHCPPQQHRHLPTLLLLDEITDGEATRRQANSKQNQARFFAPRFDLKEVKNAYHLDGELPGFEQSDISLEFTDEHTLVVSGRVEVKREEGTKPKELTSGSDQQQAAIKDSSHRATVEDEDKDTSTEVVKSSAKEDGQDESREPEHTYWVSERTSGSFTRSFSFPARVDQDGVKASLKNGILSVVVPKAPAPESRRIAIQ